MQPLHHAQVFKTNWNIYINTYSGVLLTQNPPVIFKILPGFLELFINHLLSSTEMVQNNLGGISLWVETETGPPQNSTDNIVIQSKSLLDH